MADHEGFLQDILAHPEDDAPRLIYADWLDENAGPDGRDRAAFIRRQAARVRGAAQRADRGGRPYPRRGPVPAAAGAAGAEPQPARSGGGGGAGPGETPHRPDAPGPE